jgi:hypothetical protein
MIFFVFDNRGAPVVLQGRKKKDRCEEMWRAVAAPVDP